MTLARPVLTILLFVVAACAPSAVLRDGVQVPYEQAAANDLEQARALVAEGRLDEARALLERFQVELPESRRRDEALFLLAEVEEKSGDREAAARTYARVVNEFNRSPKALEAAMRSAELYRDLGRPEVGRRVLEDAPFGRATDEERVRGHRLLADLARSSGDYVEAVRALALTRRDVADPELRRSVDLELEELLRDRLRDNELELVSERLPRGPVYDAVLLELASRQLARGDFSDALATIDRLPARLRTADDERRRSLRSRALRGAESAVYPIGLALPLSGPYAAFGESVLRGVVLGLELFAESPGRFRLVVRDTAGEPARAPLVMSELIDAGVRTVIGPMRSVVAAAAVPYAERARVPLLTPAPREDLPFLSPYAFRLGLSAADQTELLAEYATRQGRGQRFAVLYPRDSYGITFKNLFWDAMERRGATPVGVEGYDPEAVDLQQEIRKLVGLHYLTPKERRQVEERDRLQKRPLDNADRLAQLKGLPPYVDFDALFIPDSAERIGMILPQLRFFDIRSVLLLGPEDWNDPRLLEIAGRDARGSVFVGAFHANSDEPAVQDFVARFYAAFGRAPDLSAATGYDAARLIQTSVNRLGHPSPDQLIEDWTGPGSEAGVSGLTGFSEEGVPRRRLRLLEVRDEQIVALDRSR